jgi:hypothetical protein
MADTGNGNPTAGGSGTGRNVPVQAQNVVIDANAQAAAAQMAQQILANTNVTLKQELVKIPDFWGEKGKDTVTPTQFMARIDECEGWVLAKFYFVRIFFFFLSFKFFTLLI